MSATEYTRRRSTLLAAADRRAAHKRNQQALAELRTILKGVAYA